MANKIEAKALKDSGFEVPNLDDLSIDPKDIEEAKDLFYSLYRYAQYKEQAMIYRMGGDIEMALSNEEICEKIYKTLPEWARW